MPAAAGEGDHATQATDLHRGRAAVVCAAIAQFAGAVVPPGPDRAVALECDRVVIAAGEGDHPAQATDLHRGRAVGGAAIAQLAVVVQPPGPDCAVALQGEAVDVAAGDRDHATQATDLHRGRAAVCAAIAQLAVVVVPPCPDRAIALQGEAVPGAGSEGDHATQATDLHRGRAAVCAAIAQLAVVVPSPCPDRAVALQGEAVIAAAGEGDHATQATDLHRGRAAVVCAAIAQFAVAVVPPGPDRAVAVQGEAVIAARHYACTSEIGRHGLIGRRHVQGANAVLSGAYTRRPADKARSHARRGGQRHRRTRVITACAIRAAGDARWCTGDRTRTAAGLVHGQGVGIIIF